ncbi:carbohydrate deacetylase isoform X4 [Hippocampus comes]|uniref:carbohydrate deacetylase isoform X4 n=1 Tax=Hippocampus comes TaxID=109280 RepID=UPI00094EC3D9|nr:PREDICTED: carbohydrate deacetylase isoform X4 [Hippocampus comes]
MPQPRILLVVTGDDFGYCPKRNQGIVDCFKAGGISSVSLLVNASAAKDAADLAKRHNIPIGLHANLSEGIPVCQSLRQDSTLVNERGFFHGKMGFRQALGRHQISMEQSSFFYVEVELELRDQIRLFRELTGHLPHHMDGHQHVHILQEVREVFAQVLSDHKIPYTRVPVEPGLHSCQCLPAHLKRFYAQVEKDALDSIPVFRRCGLRCVGMRISFGWSMTPLDHPQVKKLQLRVCVLCFTIFLSSYMIHSLNSYIDSFLGGITIYPFSALLILLVFCDIVNEWVFLPFTF